MHVSSERATSHLIRRRRASFERDCLIRGDMSHVSSETSTGARSHPRETIVLMLLVCHNLRICKSDTYYIVHPIQCLYHTAAGSFISHPRGGEKIHYNFTLKFYWYFVQLFEKYNKMTLFNKEWTIKSCVRDFMQWEGRVTEHEMRRTTSRCWWWMLNVAFDVTVNYVLSPGRQRRRLSLDLQHLLTDEH